MGALSNILEGLLPDREEDPIETSEVEPLPVVPEYEPPIPEAPPNESNVDRIIRENRLGPKVTKVQPLLPISAPTSRRISSVKNMVFYRKSKFIG